MMKSLQSQMMFDTEMPCFRGHTVKTLEKRFQPFKTTEEATKYILEVVSTSTLNLRSRMYDILQYNQNGVEYW